MHILYGSDGAIKSFGVGDGSDWVLSPGETIEVLPNEELKSFEGRLILAADKLSIVADGKDEVAVTVSTNMKPPPASIDLDINGFVESIALVDGKGQLLIIADAPGVITIKPVDQKTYPACGRGIISIEAVRV